MGRPFFLIPAGLKRSICFTPATRDAVDALRSVLAGWPMRVEGHRPAERPFLIVTRRQGAYRIDWKGGHRTERSLVNAVATLVVDIVDAWGKDTPGLGTLHAAAAEFPGGLVLFPATHHAGKSTLMARLAAAGRRIFSDDMIGFDLAGGQAMATGGLSRLRLPVPATSAALVGYLAGAARLSDGRYCYVQPADAATVRHGTRAPIAALVILDRGAAGAARLTRATAEEALLRMLVQVARNHFDARRDFDTYRRTLEGTPAYRLVYSDVDEACDLLCRRFARRPPRAAPASLWPRSGGVRGRPAGAVSEAPATERYRRAADIRVLEVGEAAFLLEAASNRLFHLNPLGSSLWGLLEQPLARDTAFDLFTVAFPDVPPRQLAGDLDAMLSSLLSAGLVEKVR